MEENINIILASIIAITLVVILPFISILDRQNSMSYNVVLTLTTNFVENVRKKGFITKAEYNKYLLDLGSTGNRYEINLEANKKTLIHTLDDTGNIMPDGYIEDILTYNSVDILEEFSLNQNIYKFNIGDSFYIKLYNTNTTSASIIYDYLAGNLKQKIIDINYGGIIQDINWELYNLSINYAENVPSITMGLPKNVDGVFPFTPIEVNAALNYNYVFDLQETQDKTINISCILKKFRKIDVFDFNITPPFTFPYNLTAQDRIDLAALIKNYIQCNGFLATVTVTVPNQTISTLGGDLSFSIQLTNIIIYDSLVRASVSILPGLGEGEEQISNGRDSVDFNLSNKANIYKLQMSGPCMNVGGIYELYPVDGILNKIVVPRNTTIYFEFLYTIQNYDTLAEQAEALEDIKDEALDNIISTYKVIVGGEDIYIPTIPINYTDLNVTVIMNPSYPKSGSIIVSLKHMTPSLSESYITLPEGWIKLIDEGVEQYAPYGVSSSPYIIQ